MKIQLTLIFIMAILFSCHSSKKLNSSKDSNVSDVKYSIILNSSLFGNGQENIKQGEQIIKNKDDWYALTKKMNSVNSVTNSIRVSPDFEFFYFITVFHKIIGTGGLRLKIDSIKEKSDKVLITINRHSESMIGTEVMNQPFILFRIPKTTKKIVFNYID